MCVFPPRVSLSYGGLPGVSLGALGALVTSGLSSLPGGVSFGRPEGLTIRGLWGRLMGASGLLGLMGTSGDLRRTLGPRPGLGLGASDISETWGLGPFGVLARCSHSIFAVFCQGFKKWGLPPEALPVSGFPLGAGSRAPDACPTAAAPQVGWFACPVLEGRWWPPLDIGGFVVSPVCPGSARGPVEGCRPGLGFAESCAKSPLWLLGVVARGCKR